MSLIGKKPFVQEIFSAMSGEQLLRLNTLVNNLGEPEFINFNEIGQANIGVNYVRLTFNELYMNSHFGFLIYVDNEHCGFFSFQDYFEEMKSVKIDPVSHQYWYLQEHLSAEEFRRALDDAMEKVVPTPVDKDVNIITFSNVEVEQGLADLDITSDDFAKMQDTTKDCVVVIEYISGSKTTLSRMTVSGGGVIFSALRPYGEGQLEDVTADFKRIGAAEPYTYTGGLKISVFESGGGLPDATKANQVLVSNDELGWDEKKSVPLADNLLAAPITNDAMYSSGPTGGLADITTGEEAYLQEVKGMSVVWNQLYDGVNAVQLNYQHIYIDLEESYGGVQGLMILLRSNSGTISHKVIDLTLMFGGNDKIPFSLSEETEYAANGNLPAQTGYAVNRFQRLFANVDLVNATYDAGTIKNVKATKLVETGRNLWDSSTMETTGLQLLAGYRYEIYISQTGSGKKIQVSYDNGTTWSEESLTRYQRADGKYIYTFISFNFNNTYFKGNYLIKSVSGSPIVYVGFVHSGNYCLTTGTLVNPNAFTEATIPSYQKHEFNISGIDGLNGLLDNTGKVSVYDTKDYRRVGSMDLSEYANVMVYDSDWGGWILEAPSDIDINLFDEGVYLSEKGYSILDSTDENDNDILIIYNGSDSVKPTGTLLYPLSTPVATGESAFEPIALKSGDNWVVDDMGSEYFIQPANTNCPVNQVSYYYENLKDKLVNMQEPIEVASATYDYSNPALSGLKIGNLTYKLCPVGSTNNYYSFAIGDTARATSAYALAIGGSSYANGGLAIGYGANALQPDCVSIGHSANCYKRESIAIGSGTYNYLERSITFDGFSAGEARTYHCYSPEKIFFRYVPSNNSYTTYESCISGHYLSEFITNKTLVENSGNYYIAYTSATDYKTFTILVNSSGQTDISVGFTGVHLVVKLSNNVVASLDLLPYDSDNSQAFTAYGIASDTPTFVSGYLDAYGIVHLTAPSGVTISEVKYNLR